MTPLDKTMKRLIEIDGREFVLALTPEGLKLSQKGLRKGLEVTWRSLITGERALVTALQASVSELAGPRSAAPRKSLPKRRVKR